MEKLDQQKYDHFYRLIERHGTLIERLCMRRSSGDSVRCDEFVQECYIFIWKHEKKIGQDVSPLEERMWVYWLCRNALSRLRLLGRAHLLQPLDENMADTVAEREMDVALGERIRSMTANLNAHERKVVEMLAEGYTPEEMASELGIKHHSAIQLRYRVIAKLRKQFSIND